MYPILVILNAVKDLVLVILNAVKDPVLVILNAVKDLLNRFFANAQNDNVTLRMTM